MRQLNNLFRIKKKVLTLFVILQILIFTYAVEGFLLPPQKWLMEYLEKVQ